MPPKAEFTNYDSSNAKMLFFFDTWYYCTVVTIMPILILKKGTNVFVILIICLTYGYKNVGQISRLLMVAASPLLNKRCWK